MSDARSAEDVAPKYGRLGFREVHGICGWDVDIYDTTTGRSVSFDGDFRYFVAVYNAWLVDHSDGPVSGA